MTHPLRPNVCMLLVNKDERLFVGERLGEPGHWQLPQGGVNSGDSEEKAVERELEEELGLSPEKIKIERKLRATYEYDWDEPRNYGKKIYRGQTQTFWIISFLGEDPDIQIETEDPEFMSWKWCSSAELRSIASPRRLPGYLMPLREFEDWLMLRDTGLIGSPD